MNLVQSHIKELASLCELHKVDKMYLFGSAVTTDFTENSDLDFLVTFKIPEINDYFDNYMGFKDNLTCLFNRDIDLLEEQALKNPILINSINKTKELVYG